MTSAERQYRLNAWLAILFGVALMTVETLRRYGAWGHWSWWFDDYFMGCLLILGAILILKGHRLGRPVLIAAWGFNAGLLYGSFFSKYTSDTTTFQTNINPGLLIPLIGIGFGIATLALAWSLYLEVQLAKSPAKWT